MDRRLGGASRSLTQVSIVLRSGAAQNGVDLVCAASRWALGPASWDGDVRRRPERASAHSAVAPPSERKCAPSSLLDNGIGTAKSQCGWLSGPQRCRRPRSQCTRTDNKTVLVPVGVSFTVSRHQLSRLKRRSHRRRDLDGEFDPGSGRTLAACLTHASRTEPIRWQHW